MHSQTQHTIPQSQPHTTPNIHYTSCRRPMQQQVITIFIFFCPPFTSSRSTLLRCSKTPTPQHLSSPPLSLSLFLLHTNLRTRQFLLSFSSLFLSPVFFIDYWLNAVDSRCFCIPPFFFVLPLWHSHITNYTFHSIIIIILTNQLMTTTTMMMKDHTNQRNSSW